MSLPLYPATPQPPCSQCSAACCRNTCGAHTFAVLLSAEEHTRFPESIPVAEGMRALPYVDGRCIHLAADDRCCIYENRPQCCRDFNCASGYCLTKHHHGFFLEDNPAVVTLIENTFPEWVAFKQAEQPKRPG